SAGWGLASAGCVAGVSGGASRSTMARPFGRVPRRSRTLMSGSAGGSSSHELGTVCSQWRRRNASSRLRRLAADRRFVYCCDRSRRAFVWPPSAAREDPDEVLVEPVGVVDDVAAAREQAARLPPPAGVLAEGEVGVPDDVAGCAKAADRAIAD